MSTAPDPEPTYTAFAGTRMLVSGDLTTMLLRTKKYMDSDASETVLIFEDHTGRQVDFDFRGSPDEVLERALPKPASGPGRPKLGVVSREVSLLPRHWEWLELQPQGASAALRRLVDEARKRQPGKEKARIALEAASRFLWSMAGNLPDFEEASRALFTKDAKKLNALMRPWPADIRKHTRRLFDAAIELESQDA